MRWDLLCAMVALSVYWCFVGFVFGLLACDRGRRREEYGAWERW